MGRDHILVLSSTFPQYDGDPRGQFIVRYWERWAEENNADVTYLVPRTAWVNGTLQTRSNVQRFEYAPAGWSTLTGRFGILENIRANPLRCVLLVPYVLTSMRALRSAIQMGDYSRVVSHMFLPGGVLAGLVCRRYGQAFDVFGHGTDVDICTRLPVFARRWVFQILSHAQRLTVPSNEKRTRLHRAMIACGCSRDVDVETMSFEIGDAGSVGGARQRVELADNEPCVFFIGRLIRQKGVDTLLHAMAHLGGRVRLDIAGEGPLAGKLERLARKLGVNVRFHGFVEGEVKQRLFRSASVLCVPSRDDGALSEGAPLVILEAARAGVPVVAAATGGIPELCARIPHAELVPPDNSARLADAIRRTLRQSHEHAGELVCAAPNDHGVSERDSFRVHAQSTS